MSSLFEFFNRCGEVAARFAWPMLWQSSLLIAVLFTLDFALRRKVRSAVRYALWLVVLVKLVMPPSLALPTGLAWWLRPSSAPAPRVETRQFVVSYSDESLPVDSYVPDVAVAASPPVPRLSFTAIGLVASGGFSLVLFGFLVWRWRQVAGQIRKSEEPSDELRGFFTAMVREAGVRGRVRLRLTSAAMSPAVCGLIRPCVLLPRALVERLTASELRAVLLHELMHVRRADVWVNCAQTLLQIVYWWHPLLWFANARIRRLREEAVDDAVMMALREDAEVYAPTLLEVAKLAFHRPMASLGLVGILESKRALSRRIERLLDFQAPRRAGLSFVSLLSVAAFTCMAVPQGEAPAKLPSSVDKPTPEHKAIKGVVLTADGVTVTADRVTVDPEKREISAEGDAKVRRSGANGDPTPSAAPTNWARNTPVGRSNSRRILFDWLKRTRLERVSFDNVPLSEVLPFLAEQSRNGDPGNPRINFIFAPDVAKDVGTVRIKINDPLTNIVLLEVLDAIISHADKPIKYSLEDYGVLFSPKIGNPPELRLRTFRFDPTTFRQGLERAVGVAPGTFGSSDSSRTTVQAEPRVDAQGTRTYVASSNEMAFSAALRTFFQSRGANLDPPKNIFWNDRQGKLLVRATKEDLDVIEAQLAVLNTDPPQIHIQAKFVEIPQKTSAAFWKSLDATNHASGPEGIILSSTQAVAVMKALESQKGVAVLASPRVTTLAGQRAQLQIGQSLPVVTGVTNGEKEPKFLFTNIFCGPVVDLIPRADADNQTIRLTTTASVKEFLGYDDPGKEWMVEVLVGGKPTRVKLPLPRFREHNLAINATVLDGQTLVLGRPQITETVNKKGAKPAPKTEAARKDLVVFITPTLIDAAGNPIRDKSQTPNPKSQ